MRTLEKTALVLLFMLAGCGQQLVEFGNPVPVGGANSPPAVQSTDPGDTSTEVVVAKEITATFTKAMDAATVNIATFLLKQGGAPIAGTVTYAGTTARFVPTSLLDTNRLYDATITIAAKDPGGLAIAADYKWSFTTVARPPPPLAINLGLAATFGLATRAGLTSTGVTVVNGDVALWQPSPTCTDATGGPAGSARPPPGCVPTSGRTLSPSTTGLTVNGLFYWPVDSDSGLTAHQVTNDLNTAWVEGQNKIPTQPTIAADELGGKTFIPGIYHNANLTLMAGGVATLDAQNDANAVFIFQADTDLISADPTAGPSAVALANGAQARNVWFIVGRDITVGRLTNWHGNILAGRTVTVKDGATVLGRVLAGAGGAGQLSLVGAASPSVTTVTVPK